MYLSAQLVLPGDRVACSEREKERQKGVGCGGWRQSGGGGSGDLWEGSVLAAAKLTCRCCFRRERKRRRGEKEGVQLSAAESGRRAVRCGSAGEASGQEAKGACSRAPAPLRRRTMDDERLVRLARRGSAKRAGAFLLASGGRGGRWARKPGGRCLSRIR